MKRLLITVFLASAGFLSAASALGLTPTEELFKSVSIDNLRDVRRLVQDGVVDPNTTNARGENALMAAIRDDATRVADYLITSGKVSLEATNPQSETALMLAAFKNQPAVADRLLERGAEVNRSGWTALHYAASSGATDIVKALLKRGAAVDAPSPNNTTPLMMAARSDHAEAARVLVAAGADPTRANQSDLTAADYARRANDEELEGWLRQQMEAWKARGGTSPGKS